MTTDTKFDQVSFTMAYEAGELEEAEIISGFQELINSGLAWQLQGSYGRMAQSLIDAGHCTRVAPPQSPTKLGPYERVSRNETRKVGDEDLRLVLYGAYNAMGLVGSECNGVAVLSDTRMTVICDELGIESSGYYGPSAAQTKLFDHLMKCSDADFRAIVNSSSRCRHMV